METGTTTADLIHVPIPKLIAATIPLLAVALYSYRMGLDLEIPVLVGTVRTAIQLTICGLILTPIFYYGERPHFSDFGWLIVLLYFLFMIFLAAWETSRRSKYYFDGMFLCILGSFMLSVGSVSIFAFAFIIQPSPFWMPQYVIPIGGMLLGNCINGVALSLDQILTALKESTTELELLLSFGATCDEASNHLVREAVRVGTMPLVNAMRVIGLISIPGMMTGQILAGSSVTEAAQYQILITYLIATTAFGTILSEVHVATLVGFDRRHQRLLKERFKERNKSDEDLSFRRGIGRRDGFMRADDETKPLKGDVQSSSPPSYVHGSEDTPASGTIKLVRIRGSGNAPTADGVPVPPTLELRRISRTVFLKSRLGDETSTRLFEDISMSLFPGDVVAVRGPSGAGKTQFLRICAGLTPMDNEDVSSKDYGQILLLGENRRLFPNRADWRRSVIYVSQYKVDIIGTPRQFVDKITNLKSWQRIRQKETKNVVPTMTPTGAEMIPIISQLLGAWGLDPETCLDAEWRLLSGGEAQRVFVAISLAARPAVLLMDESTSSLDSTSKQQVEESILQAAATLGVCVVWVTHDEEQMHRMTQE